MPPVQCHCPSCRTLLQIAQAPPVQARCSCCGATFVVGPVAPPPAAEAPHIPIAPVRTPTAPALPQVATNPARRKRLLFVVGLGAVLVLGITLVVARLGGRAAAEEEDNDDPSLPAQQRQFNKAIRRGVAYLKKRLQDETSLYSIGDARGGEGHVGATALAGLTLLECGVRAEDPALQAALETVRARAPRLRFTYSIATAILFLDRLNNPKERSVNAADRDSIKSMALRLIAGQNSAGGWAYHCEPLSEASVETLLTQLREDRFRPGSLLVPGQRPGRDDNSIGQFATLALWAARKHGVPVRLSLKAVEARYRLRQRPNGCWRYNDAFGPHLRDTSTCAGLIGLAVGRGIDEEPAGAAKEKKAARDIRKDPAVQKALRYVGQVIGKQPRLTAEEEERRQEHTAAIEQVLRELEAAPEWEKPALAMRLMQFDKPQLLRGAYFDGDNWGDLYFLWSLERTAMIYDLEKIEGKDWYAWGSEIILARQGEDGSWAERFPGVPDTCFALLFLKRANVVKDLTDKLRSVLPSNPRVGAPPPTAPRQPGKKDEKAGR